MLFKLFLVHLFFFLHFFGGAFFVFMYVQSSCVTCDSSPMECCSAISERERERGMSGKKRPAMSRRTQENWRGGNDDIEKMYEELVNLLVVFSHTAKNHRKKNGEDASKYVRKVDSSLN